MDVHGVAWELAETRKPLVRRERRWGAPEKGSALVEVAGCGVCHTDLGFADGAVPPRAALPLVLGHEISGRVIAIGDERHEKLVGTWVLAPSVSPCRRCPACLRGRNTACERGRMPGNDADGGFATHVMVPAHDLVPIPSPGTTFLLPWQIAPIADAGSTAEQAIVRAQVGDGDVVIFVGTGGVGSFGAQLARARGARVIAMDKDAARLELVAPLVDEVLNTSDLEPKAIRSATREIVRRRGWEKAPRRVFETSGTTGGQLAAFELIERGGSLSIVGYTPSTVTVRMSNVMALDAEIFGNWGCDPAWYGPVVDRALEGSLQVARFIESHPLSAVNDVLDAMRGHALRKRAVLVPS